MMHGQKNIKLCVWNGMTHAQKPGFVFRRNGRVHLNRRGASVQSTTSSRGVSISGTNAGNTMFRGCVKSTGYPLHSPVSPPLPLPCVTVCHHISAGLYCYVEAILLWLLDTQLKSASLWMPLHQLQCSLGFDETSLNPTMNTAVDANLRINYCLLFVPILHYL